MTDLKIDFNGMCRLNLSASVSGKDATAQKCLVVAVTAKGTDRMFPEKGTNLLKGCTGAVIISGNAAVHLCNFAALDTLYFINDTDGLAPDAPDGLEDYDLDIVDYNAREGRVKFASTVRYPDGTQTTTPTIVDTYYAGT